MSEDHSSRPHKGILKTSSSIDDHRKKGSERKESLKDDIKWDEMNILATLHPEGKDYGHMKVDEPKTPYSYDSAGSSELDPNQLAASLNAAVSHSNEKSEAKRTSPPRPHSPPPPLLIAQEDNLDFDEDMQHHDPEFEKKRRMHYNEYQAVKLAKKLLSNEIPDADKLAAEEDRRIKEAELNAKKNLQILSQYKNGPD